MIPFEEIQKKFPGIDIEENKKYLENLFRKFPDNRKIQAVFSSIQGLSNSDILNKYGIRTGSIVKWRNDFLADKENFYKESVGRVIGNRKILQEKTSIEKVQELIGREKEDSIFRKRLLAILDILKNQKLTLKDVANKRNLSVVAVTKYVSIAAKNGIESLKPRNEFDSDIEDGQETVVAEVKDKEDSITNDEVSSNLEISEKGSYIPERLSESDSNMVSDIYRTIDENPNINAMSLTRLHVVLLMIYGFSKQELSVIFREKESDMEEWHRMMKERGASYYLNPNLFSAFVKKDEKDEKDESSKGEKSLGYKTWNKFEVPKDIKSNKGTANPINVLDRVHDMQKDVDNGRLPMDDSERNKEAREYVLKNFLPHTEYEKFTKAMILDILSDESISDISERIHVMNRKEVEHLRKDAWEGKFSQKGYLFILSKLVQFRLENTETDWTSPHREKGSDSKFLAFLKNVRKTSNSQNYDSKPNVSASSSEVPSSSKITVSENVDSIPSSEISSPEITVSENADSIPSSEISSPEITVSENKNSVEETEADKIIQYKLGLKSKQEQIQMTEQVNELMKKYSDNKRLAAISYILSGYSFRKSAKLSGWGDSTLRRFCQLVRDGGIQNLIRIDGISI